MRPDASDSEVDRIKQGIKDQGGNIRCVFEHLHYILH